MSIKPSNIISSYLSAYTTNTLTYNDSQGMMTRKIIDQGKIEETAVPATINAKEMSRPTVPACFLVKI